MLNLVEQDLNKNANTDGKADGSVKQVLIPLNSDDLQKANLSQENKNENKKNKADKESKDAINIEKSIS